MESYDLTRIIFLKTLAAIYLLGFINIVNQYRGLLGEGGLLPIKDFIQRVHWKRSLSLFFLNSEDKTLNFAGWLGLILSLVALFGGSEKFGYIGHVLVWGLLWILYLSFVNVGQIFYGFGWESLLLETGFLAIFFPPDSIQTPWVLMWLVRWILFRVMFGAGMIKLRADPCWKDLTCMYYHYETQPMPNPLSRYFHFLPKKFHQLEVLTTHFVELIVPWGVFFPGIIGYSAGILIALFQFGLILSGNLSWLNYLTIVLCIACFADPFWENAFSLYVPEVEPASSVYLGIVIVLTLFLLYKSRQPIKNLISPNQAMNTSYDPLHILNSYGAFGAVTKKRYEIILEGTSDSDLQNASWKEYSFKGKPGNITRCPPIIAPYHLRLDWLMWFAAMSSYKQHPWLVELIRQFLENKKSALRLIKGNPFPNHPPKYIRAELFHYEFTEPGSKNWWKRQRVRSYLPPISLNDL